MMLAGEILTPSSDKEAIAFEDGECHSYVGLSTLADRFANFFRGLGLDSGDRVSFLCANDPLLVAGYFGAFRSGLIANPLNNRLTPSELAYILNHAQSRCVVVSPEFTEQLNATLPLLNEKPEILAIRTQDDLPFAAHSEEHVGAAPAELQPSWSPDPNDGALLIYTSGTTGMPKGVLLSHHNIVSAVSYVRRGFEIGPEDRTLCVMPQFHTNGLMFSTLPFLAAGGTVILRRRFSATRFWAQCRDNRVNSFSASPTILAFLLEHEANAPPLEQINLKYVKVASAPTSVDLANRFENRFGKGLLLETFGLTETTAISTMNPLHGPRKFGSIGSALEPQEVRIADEEGRWLPPETVGEICIRGETVMKEYFRDPDSTAKSIRDGWLRTGDLARMDSDGFVYMVGRAKEIIVRGGENISPLEIEDVVARCPGVREAAVIGIPDPMWGEIVGLCIATDKSLTKDEVIGHCREHLSDFKIPQVVRFVDELPRNAMGKVTKRRLNELF